MSLLLTAPVFYQLDYRERIEASVAVPGLAGFAVKKSLESRYRPVKTDSKPLELKSRLKKASI